jgi:hypothetical protein
MSRSLMMFSLALVPALSAAGCTVATVRVRQDDGTYRTTQELVWTHELDWRSYRTFTCQDDYMVATQMWDVTYEWPKGKGRLEEDGTTTFEGDGIEAETRKRMLTVNGRQYGEFAKGDRVRITPDGAVLVNGEEAMPHADESNAAGGA